MADPVTKGKQELTSAKSFLAGRLKQKIGPANSATDLERRANDFEKLIAKHGQVLSSGGQTAFLDEMRAFLLEARATIAGAVVEASKKDIETVRKWVETARSKPNNANQIATYMKQLNDKIQKHKPSLSQSDAGRQYLAELDAFIAAVSNTTPAAAAPAPAKPQASPASAAVAKPSPSSSVSRPAPGPSSSSSPSPASSVPASSTARGSVAPASSATTAVLAGFDKNKYDQYKRGLQSALQTKNAAQAEKYFGEMQAVGGSEATLKGELEDFREKVQQLLVAHHSKTVETPRKWVRDAIAKQQVKLDYLQKLEEALEKSRGTLSAFDAGRQYVSEVEEEIAAAKKAFGGLNLSREGQQLCEQTMHLCEALMKAMSRKDASATTRAWKAIEDAQLEGRLADSKYSSLEMVQTTKHKFGLVKQKYQAEAGGIQAAGALKDTAPNLERDVGELENYLGKVSLEAVYKDLVEYTASNMAHRLNPSTIESYKFSDDFEHGELRKYMENVKKALLALEGKVDAGDSQIASLFGRAKKGIEAAEKHFVQKHASEQKAIAEASQAEGKIEFGTTPEGPFQSNPTFTSDDKIYMRVTVPIDYIKIFGADKKGFRTSEISVVFLTLVDGKAWPDNWASVYWWKPDDPSFHVNWRKEHPKRDLERIGNSLEWEVVGDPDLPLPWFRPMYRNFMSPRIFKGLSVGNHTIKMRMDSFYNTYKNGAGRPCVLAEGEFTLQVKEGGPAKYEQLEKDIRKKKDSAFSAGVAARTQKENAMYSGWMYIRSKGEFTGFVWDGSQLRPYSTNSTHFSFDGQYIKYSKTGRGYKWVVDNSKPGAGRIVDEMDESKYWTFDGKYFYPHLKTASDGFLREGDLIRPYTNGCPDRTEWIVKNEMHPALMLVVLFQRHILEEWKEG